LTDDEFKNLMFHFGTSSWADTKSTLCIYRTGRGYAFWQQAYPANAIPRLVIVAKEGDIINFNAPKLSSGNEIEHFLLAEIKEN
jgi:hypothetical protein